MTSVHTFVLPERLIARAPAEQRGLRRDGVRLLVIDRRTHSVTHSTFRRFEEFLGRGDLLVFNRSRTLPALLRGTTRGTSSSGVIEARLAERLPNGEWVALMLGDVRPGSAVDFADDLSAVVEAPEGSVAGLWKLRFTVGGATLISRLHELGRPIQYEYAAGGLRLDDYQTIAGAVPGSAEMASAARAFTWEMLFRLQRRGIATASLVLHTGLSSYMDDAVDAVHPTPEEEYEIPQQTVEKIRAAKTAGGRVIAVGTTVVRALESAAAAGDLRAGHAYTRLRIGPSHVLQVADGILTGLHEPEATHLDLLSAFLPEAALRRAYDEAIERGYLWHEFGDLNLIA